MSYEAINAVLAHSESEMAERLVLFVIAERAGVYDIAYPSIDDTAKRARMHRDSVRRVLERLYESGDLLPRYRVGSSTCYMVTSGKPAEKVEADVLAAWGVTVGQLKQENFAALEKMSAAKGQKLPPKKGKTKTTPLIADQSVYPLTDDQSVGPNNPLIADQCPPIDRGSIYPLIADQSEPSLNHHLNHANEVANAPVLEPASPKTRDPIEHALNRKAKAEAEGRHVQLLRTATHNGQERACEIAIAFCELTQIKPTTGQQAKSSIAAAVEIIDGGASVEDVREAWRKSRDVRGGFTVASLQSLKKTAIALAAERKSKPSKRAYTWATNAKGEAYKVYVDEVTA